MKRTLLLVILIVQAGFALADQTPAVPLYITYQGTLKQNGLPGTGPHTMGFTLLDSQGIPQGAPVTVNNVQVNQGLFSVQLDFTANGTHPVNWQGITPSIQVSIDGQQLTPNEPLTSTAYSLMSASIVDGAVTVQKLDPTTVQPFLIPSGMIAMFAMSCPTGWTRFSALDNKFPMGLDTYGNTGGSATHNHGGYVGDTNPTASRVTTCNDPGFQPDELMQDLGTCDYLKRLTKHDHTIAPDSNIPPYVTVVWCQKN